MARKYLITGGAGFIGSNFIRYLLNMDSECHVVNLDKLTYAGNRENLSDWEGNSRYQFVLGDICDAQIVEQILASGIDYIFNFAAETHVDRSILDPGGFIRTDVMGTHVLLESARKFPVSLFIQISTDEVYGSIESGAFKETDPVKPSSPYSASKASGELLVLAYVKTYKLPAVITRASNNYGPFQYPEKLVPLFVTNALEDQPLPLYGDGLNVRDWLYVEDHCRALDLIHRLGIPGEVYNIGGNNEHTNLEITHRILDLLKKPLTMIQPIKDRPGHDRRYAVDSSKIRALGWVPLTTFEQGICQTVEWYKNNPDWWNKLKAKNKEFKEYYQNWYQHQLGMEK